MDLIFHGVGTSQLVFADRSFITIDKSQDLSIQTSVSEQKVHGGDGLYALLNYITEKSAKLSITNAVFNLEGIKAATGSDISTGAEVLVHSEKKVVTTGACTLDNTLNVVVDSVIAKVVETGQVLTNIGATGTPTATQFVVTAAGHIDVDTSLNGKTIEFSYVYTVATGSSVNMLEDDVPKTCEFRHTLITDEMEDGKRYQLTIRAFRCKATGAYNYEAKRGSAFAPKIELEILDAGRTDKKILTYNIVEYTG